MKQFYTTYNDLLMTVGFSDPSHVSLEEGHKLHIGWPEGYDPNKVMPSGFKWNVVTKGWVDLRSDDQIKQDVLTSVLIARRRAYPDLADLADAVYWEQKGDPSKMEAYKAKVEAVKRQFPKPS